jgi:hypothetical protein
MANGVEAGTTAGAHRLQLAVHRRVSRSEQRIISFAVGSIKSHQPLDNNLHPHLFFDLTNERLLLRFARFRPASGAIPAINIATMTEQHLLTLIHNQGKDANGKHVRLAFFLLNHSTCP